MVSEEELYAKVKKLKEIIPENEWKYYYFNSIQNFIYHLKSLNERSRQRTALEINNYIEVMSQEFHAENSVWEKSKKLFPLVWGLSDIYRSEIGFIKKPDYLISLIIFLCLFLALKVGLQTLEALIISICIFTPYFIYGYIKTRAKKVY